jgi:hypothetical protein
VFAHIGSLKYLGDPRSFAGGCASDVAVCCGSVTCQTSTAVTSGGKVSMLVTINLSR